MRKAPTVPDHHYSRIHSMLGPDGLLSALDETEFVFWFESRYNVVNVEHLTDCMCTGFVVT